MPTKFPSSSTAHDIATDAGCGNEEIERICREFEEKIDDLIAQLTIEQLIEKFRYELGESIERFTREQFQKVSALVQQDARGGKKMKKPRKAVKKTIRPAKPDGASLARAKRHYKKHKVAAKPAERTSNTTHAKRPTKSKSHVTKAGVVSPLRPIASSKIAGSANDSRAYEAAVPTREKDTIEVPRRNTPVRGLTPGVITEDVARIPAMRVPAPVPYTLLQGGGKMGGDSRDGATSAPSPTFISQPTSKAPVLTAKPVGTDFVDAPVPTSGIGEIISSLRRTAENVMVTLKASGFVESPERTNWYPNIPLNMPARPVGNVGGNIPKGLSSGASQTKNGEQSGPKPEAAYVPEKRPCYRLSSAANQTDSDSPKKRKKRRNSQEMEAAEEARLNLYETARRQLRTLKGEWGGLDEPEKEQRTGKIYITFSPANNHRIIFTRMAAAVLECEYADIKDVMEGYLGSTCAVQRNGGRKGRRKSISVDGIGAVSPENIRKEWPNLSWHQRVSAIALFFNQIRDTVGQAKALPRLCLKIQFLKQETIVGYLTLASINFVKNDTNDKIFTHENVSRIGKMRLQFGELLVLVKLHRVMFKALQDGRTAELPKILMAFEKELATIAETIEKLQPGVEYPIKESPYSRDCKGLIGDKVTIIPRNDTEYAGLLERLKPKDGQILVRDSRHCPSAIDPRAILPPPEEDDDSTSHRKMKTKGKIGCKKASTKPIPSSDDGDDTSDDGDGEHDEDEAGGEDEEDGEKERAALRRATSGPTDSDLASVEDAGEEPLDTEALADSLEEEGDDPPEAEI